MSYIVQTPYKPVAVDPDIAAVFKRNGSTVVTYNQPALDWLFDSNRTDGETHAN